jgi:hypothetical protein
VPTARVIVTFDAKQYADFRGIFIESLVQGSRSMIAILRRLVAMEVHMPDAPPSAPVSEIVATSIHPRAATKLESSA